MIKSKNFSYIFIFMAIFSIMFTSCSPSTTSRAGKYSSANKRKTNETSSKEDRNYTYAKKTKTPTGTKTKISELREEIVSSAIRYEGTQYRSGGKSPETGFDCSGFTGFIFTKNGIPLSGPSHKLAELGKQKSKNDLMPGDLVFFGSEERISHVAIVSDNSDDQLKVVHATTSAGVKIDEISHSEYWTSRFLFGRDVISK